MVARTLRATGYRSDKRAGVSQRNPGSSPDERPPVCALYDLRKIKNFFR